MRLYAISDLHIGYESNRDALMQLPSHVEDWLIVAGDIGETEQDLEFALSQLSRRFAQLIWVPGNHDLWTLPNRQGQLRGEDKYRQLVAICRSYGVLTPEDPYVRWPGEGPPYVLAPIFTLYDYSFRPPNISREEAIAWAEASGVVSADEILLHPDPYPSRDAWCAVRCAYTERRLRDIPAGDRVVLIGHFPLREDLVRIPRIPRFSLWCGTRRTQDWHVRFPVEIVVSGHLHVRSTDYRDGVRFEEVSLGYPQHWRQARGIEGYLREILPGPRTAS